MYGSRVKALTLLNCVCLLPGIDLLRLWDRSGCFQYYQPSYLVLSDGARVDVQEGGDHRHDSAERNTLAAGVVNAAFFQGRACHELLHRPSHARRVPAGRL